MSTSVIVAGARTPMGRLLGSLKDFSGAQLGGVAIKAALERAGVGARAGRVRDHGPGAARRAPGRSRPGRPRSPAASRWTSRRSRSTRCACPGIDAIALADQLIRAGEFDIVVAGGQESMTQAPHLLAQVARGLQVRRRDDDRPHGLRRPVLRVRPASRWVRRPRQLQRPVRRSPARSRTRSPRARTSGPPRPPKDGVFADEIVPVEIPQRKGDPVEFTDRRGHPRRHHRRERSAKLRPAFRADGTITAGSASQISDGAAAVVVMSKAKAEELGLTWLAEIGAHGVVAGPDATPARAARQRHREGVRRRRASPPPTWTSSRSTRRSRRSASSRPASWASTRTRSTSTAARSRSATRSACPARGITLHLALELKRRGGGHRRGGAVRRRRPGRRADREGAHPLTVSPAIRHGESCESTQRVPESSTASRGIRHGESLALPR